MTKEVGKEHDFSLYSLVCEDCGTQEEMEFLREKRAVEAEIRFLQKKYPDNEWDGVNEHWYAYFNDRNNQIDFDYSSNGRCADFYFPTEESVKEMIETVTEERYMKYILEI